MLQMPFTVLQTYIIEKLRSQRNNDMFRIMLIRTSVGWMIYAHDDATLNDGPHDSAEALLIPGSQQEAFADELYTRIKLENGFY